MGRPSILETIAIGSRITLHVRCTGITNYLTDKRYGRGEGETMLYRYVFREYYPREGFYIYTGVADFCVANEEVWMRATVKRYDMGGIRLSRPKRVAEPEKELGL